MAFLTFSFPLFRRRDWLRQTVLGARLAVWVTFLVFSQPSGAPEAIMGNEKDLKVAFLYNFAVYTEWPMPLPEGLTFCILGRDDLGSSLDALAGRQIGGKPVTVRHLNSSDARTDSGGCHLTYSAALSEAKLGKTSPDLYPKAILSVSGIANTDPAIIDLAREGNRLVFDIDNSRAHAAGLSISSKLLRLARSVR